MLQSITPRFIKTLDARLLEKHPVLWMSRIHYVLWHGLLFGALSAGLGLILPFQLQNDIPYHLWYFIFSLVAFVLFCNWTYHYMIFNKEKHFGYRKAADAYLDFGLLFFTLSLFLLLPWPLQFTLSTRVASSFEKAEVIHDLNVLNETYPYIVDSDSKYENWRDSSNREIKYFHIQKLDKTLHGYFTPHFMYFYGEQYTGLLSDKEITDSYNPNIDSATLFKKIRLFLTTAKKYNDLHRYDAAFYTARFRSFLREKAIPASEACPINEDNSTENLSSTIKNVCSAQYKKLFFYEEEYFRFLFHAVIALVTLLTLFKMVYWRQFLITGVVFIFYPIVTYTLSVLVGGDSLFEIWLVGFVALSCISLFLARGLSYFKPVINILNQAFYVLCAYIPSIVLMLIYGHSNVFHNKDQMIPLAESQNPDLIATNRMTDYLRNYWEMEFLRWENALLYLGILVFILAQPLLRALFIKQQALPGRT